MCRFCINLGLPDPVFLFLFWSMLVVCWLLGGNLPESVYIPRRAGHIMYCIPGNVYVRQHDIFIIVVAARGGSYRVSHIMYLCIRRYY